MQHQNCPRSLLAAVRTYASDVQPFRILSIDERGILEIRGEERRAEYAQGGRVQDCDESTGRTGVASNYCHSTFHGACRWLVIPRQREPATSESNLVRGGTVAESWPFTSLNYPARSCQRERP
ncbi:hypothetical protein K0M31_009794 [Melipona bicolor]|uniref:Uncharacterized protein n=1 Tax=Melipona bicolor TaxID=60889 RepID=A0AA40FMP2_9HYME|nr:hypothetical protein K0M31_009794 [Melipona bicolor]